VEELCEEACVRNTAEEKPVRIGALQRYATDRLFEAGGHPFTRAPATGRRVAVVGAGPAGLACAHRLAMLGHDVVVFEAHEKGGGLNEYGIAAYKVPGGFAGREVDFILAIGGITLRCGAALGRDVHLADLRRDFDAVFLGLGHNAVRALGVEGEAAEGVIDAVAYIARLRQADLSSLPVGRRVVVIGGGNTAIDIATQARRLGAEDVTIAYRRGPETMSATWKEQEWAKTNGVRILHWARPHRIIAEAGRLAAVELEETRIGEQGRLDGTGRTFALAADQLFKAVGQYFIPEAPGIAGALEVRDGRIVVTGEGETSMPGVFAGGDCVAGIDLTVSAVEDGKRAAVAIDGRLGAMPAGGRPAPAGR
jgi:glutamate synthase (NADPH/NADH) small chain